MVGVVQARMSSTRLPQKALALIAGKPMLEQVLARARQIAGIHELVLATGPGDENRPLLYLAWRLGVATYIGSETDVLARVHDAASRHGADVVVRITGDCPLLDPVGSGDVLRYFLSGTWDYVSNVDDMTDGLDTEAMTLSALFHAKQLAKDPQEREHVTRYIRLRPDQFRLGKFVASCTDNGDKWSVDSLEDLERVRRVYSNSSVRD